MPSSTLRLLQAILSLSVLSQSAAQLPPISQIQPKPILPHASRQVHLNIATSQQAALSPPAREKYNSASALALASILPHLAPAIAQPQQQYPAVPVIPEQTVPSTVQPPPPATVAPVVAEPMAELTELKTSAGSEEPRPPPPPPKFVRAQLSPVPKQAAAAVQQQQQMMIAQQQAMQLAQQQQMYQQQLYIPRPLPQPQRPMAFSSYGSLNAPQQQQQGNSAIMSYLNVPKVETVAPASVSIETSTPSKEEAALARLANSLTDPAMVNLYAQPEKLLEKLPVQEVEKEVKQVLKTCNEGTPIVVDDIKITSESIDQLASIAKSFATNPNWRHMKFSDLSNALQISNVDFLGQLAYPQQPVRSPGIA